MALCGQHGPRRTEGKRCCLAQFWQRAAEAKFSKVTAEVLIQRNPSPCLLSSLIILLFFCPPFWPSLLFSFLFFLLSFLPHSLSLSYLSPTPLLTLTVFCVVWKGPGVSQKVMKLEEFILPRLEKKQLSHLNTVSPQLVQKEGGRTVQGGRHQIELPFTLLDKTYPVGSLTPTSLLHLHSK